MQRRSVVRRVSGRAERGIPATLARAAEQLQRVLDAHAVFASEMDSEGMLHCLGVAPAETARFAPVFLGAIPPGTAVLDDSRRALFARSYQISEHDTVVTVPVAGSGEFRGLLTAVVSEPPGAQMMRMLDAWAELLGDLVDEESAHRALDVRTTAVEQLQGVLELMLSLASEAVVAVDLDGRIIRWNRGAEMLYGWRASEVMGTVLPMVEAERRMAAVARLRDIASAGPMTAVPNLDHRTATGATLRLHATQLPLIDADGDVYGLVAVLQGENASPLAVKANPPGVSEAVLARLAAPVTAVSGFVQLLSRNDVLRDPVVRESALRSLASRCREIANIGEELRLATRLLDAEPILHLSPEDPGLALQRAVERGLDSEAYRVTIDADEGLSANVDLECLEGALVGLLRGLLRCHHEESALKVSVHSEDGGIAIVLNATPGSGLGVAEHPESGLGIHLARLCARAHGGSFGVHSERDETEVRLVMPVAFGEVGSGDTCLMN